MEVRLICLTHTVYNFFSFENRSIYEHFPRMLSRWTNGPLISDLLKITTKFQNCNFLLGSNYVAVFSTKVVLNKCFLLNPE